MKALVSIHDVTPANAEGVRALWTVCASAGIQPALLVVPRWHGGWPLDRDPEFTDWLVAMERDGAEILLHGERHDEFGSVRSTWDELRALGRTAREGEFLTLDVASARARIERGLRMLRDVGLSPIGFVPPAWLARADTHRATREAGLAVSESESAVYLHKRAMHVPTPVIRWSARARWRAALSVRVARARLRTTRSDWLLRIALHPQDLVSPDVARSIRETLDCIAHQRHSWRYADL